jgi:hypothetical protein
MEIVRKLLPLLVFTASLGAHASEKKLVVPPDVLARIRAAHTIFVSNAGEDDTLTGFRNSIASGYRAMYQALAGWPGIQLVDSPAHADLIFQVRGTGTIDGYSGSPFPSKGNPTGNLTVEATSTLCLSVLDPATQRVIWNNQENIDGRGVKSILAPIEPTEPAPHPVNKPALLPAQLKNPTKLFIQLAPALETPAVSDAQAAFSQALLKAGTYKLVDSASEADLVLSLYVDANKPVKNRPQLNYMKVKSPASMAAGSYAARRLRESTNWRQRGCACSTSTSRRNALQAVRP